MRVSASTFDEVFTVTNGDVTAAAQRRPRKGIGAQLAALWVATARDYASERPIGNRREPD